MFKVIIIVDNEEYIYGTYANENHANEIALRIRDQRDIPTYTIETEE